MPPRSWQFQTSYLESFRYSLEGNHPELSSKYRPCGRFLKWRERSHRLEHLACRHGSARGIADANYYKIGTSGEFCGLSASGWVPAPWSSNGHNEGGGFKTVSSCGLGNGLFIWQLVH